MNPYYDVDCAFERATGYKPKQLIKEDGIDRMIAEAERGDEDAKRLLDALMKLDF